MITKSQVYKIQELSRSVTTAELLYAAAKTRQEQDDAIKSLRNANNEINAYLQSLVKE